MSEEEPLSSILSSDELEDIYKYIVEKSEKLAGSILQESVEKYGMNGPTSLGIAVDILAQATGRVASVLAKITGRGDTIVDSISFSVGEYINNFEKFMNDNKDNENVAMDKEEY